jgi:hypothetical protein
VVDLFLTELETMVVIITVLGESKVGGKEKQK